MTEFYQTVILCVMIAFGCFVAGGMAGIQNDWANPDVAVGVCIALAGFIYFLWVRPLWLAEDRKRKRNTNTN